MGSSRCKCNRNKEEESVSDKAGDLDRESKLTGDECVGVGQDDPQI